MFETAETFEVKEKQFSLSNLLEEQPTFNSIGGIK